MVGDAGHGGSELKAQLGALAVLLGDSIDIVEDGGDEGVDIVVGDIVTDEDDCRDCNGLDILRGAVDVSGDGVSGVVGAAGEELIHVLVIDADEVDLSAGGQVNDSSGGSAGDDEGRVDLLILQALGAVAEALVNGGDVGLG